MKTRKLCLSLFLSLPLLVSCQNDFPTTNSYPVPGPAYWDLTYEESNDYQVITEGGITRFFQYNTFTFEIDILNEEKSLALVLANDKEIYPDSEGIYSLWMTPPGIDLTIRLTDKRTSLDTTDYTSKTYTIDYQKQQLSNEYNIVYQQGKNTVELTNRNYAIYEEETSSLLYQFYPGDLLTIYEKENTSSFAILKKAKVAKGLIDFTKSTYTFIPDDSSLSFMDTKITSTFDRYQFYNSSETYQNGKENGKDTAVIYAFYSPEANSENLYEIKGYSYSPDLRY